MENHFSKNNISIKKEILNQFCNHCGRSVAWGSGWFINRVPDCNDFETRIANHLKYPKGDYVCIECDSKTADDF